MIRFKFLLLIFGCLVVTGICSQNFKWATGLPGTSTDPGHFMITDQDGNLYTVGNFWGMTDIDPGPDTSFLDLKNGETYLAKYNPAGIRLWIKQIGLHTSRNTPSIAYDPSGYIYLTGTFDDTADFDPGPGKYILKTKKYSIQTYALKLDTAGNFVWAETFGLNTDKISCTSDKNGNIYITGLFRDTADFDPGPAIFLMSSEIFRNIFILKLDRNGKFIFVHQIGSKNSEIQVTDVNLDVSENILLSGIFSSTVDFDPGLNKKELTSIGKLDGFIVSLDSSGNFKWVSQTGGRLDDAVISVTSDRSGNVYGAGYYKDTVYFNNIYAFKLTSKSYCPNFIFKMNGQGNILWYKKFSSPENINNAQDIHLLAIDHNGNLNIAGTFLDTAEFDPGPADYTMISTQDHEGFLDVLDPDGNFIWAGRFGGDHCDGAICVTPDFLGNVFVKGWMSDTVDLDPGKGSFYLYEKYGNNSYIVKLTSPNLGTELFQNNPRILIYPNPSTSHFNVRLMDNPDIMEVRILDMTGKVVLNKILYNSSSFQFDLNSPPGVYFMVLISKGRNPLVSILIKQ